MRSGMVHCCATNPICASTKSNGPLSTAGRKPTFHPEAKLVLFFFKPCPFCRVTCGAVLRKWCSQLKLPQPDAGSNIDSHRVALAINRVANTLRYRSPRKHLAKVRDINEQVPVTALHADFGPGVGQSLSYFSRSCLRCSPCFLQYRPREELKRSTTSTDAREVHPGWQHLT